MTAVGTHVVDLKCMNEDPEITEAEVFFGISLIAAVTPLILIFSSIMLWSCLSKCCHKHQSCAVAPSNLLHWLKQIQNLY